MITRMRALLTGLVALAALGLVVIGLPIVLYRVGGSPLPRHIAGWHRIGSVLTSHDNGTVLLAVVRDCSWLAWLLFSIAVLAEVQAALRGRAAPRLRLGGLQGGAAKLVALAALTFSAPPALTLTASAAAVPAQTSTVHAGPLNAPVNIGPVNGGLADVAYVTPDTTAQPSAPSARTVTVQAGDCLWSIAQRYLGAGDLYPEIASMNYGHDMGDGQAFTNPALIEPGWQLQLPARGAHASPAPEQTATHHLGHATRDQHYRRRHAAASHSAAPAATSGLASAGDATLQASPGGYQTSANVARSAGEHMPDLGVFAMGALAGAVLTSLGRLRRRQRQYRRRGRRIALPADPQTLATEQRLRAAAPPGPPSTLADALTSLETGILGAGQVLPDIVGLHVTPDTLEVLLAAPALDSPPPPFQISPGRQGMCWQLALPAGRDAAGPGEPGGHGSGLLPGLVTAGGTDAGYLLLDLESLQVTGCDGPGALIDEVITAAATELATGQWSGWYDLVLVGFDELAVLGRAEHCASVDDAIARLEERGEVLRHRLGDDPSADVRQLRLAAPDDEDWGLTIMVSRVEPTAAELTQLLELAEDGPGGIAVLMAGDPETGDGRMAPTVLQLAPDPDRPGEILANVIPLQITVRPQSLSAAEYRAVSTLFAAATDLDDVGADSEPYALFAAPPWLPQAEPADDLPPADGPAWHHAAEFTVPSWDGGQGGWPVASGASMPADGMTADTTPADGVAAPPWVTGQHARPAGGGRPDRLEVRILGQFVIVGAIEQLQPKQAELVLALALAAPGGLSNSALCSMLGADPDHPKPSDAVRQIITRARRRLGRAGDGQEYIIHAGNGNYMLHQEAWLDWTEFRNLIASGRAEDMRAALALVRGEPFSGSYYWWIDIPLLETVRAEIVDAAESLGEFELATGVPRAAARAARAGLSAETCAEQLWRLLMRAEHAAGNTAGVAEAWRHCLDAIEDVAPGGEPHPDTEALYAQLISPARQHVSSRS